MGRPGDDADRVDVDRPSSARIYDYFLGGAHNFEVDRRASAALEALHPAIGRGMRANRSYLRRAVGFLSEQGIDQFLDLGSGIPTVGNVHEIAQRVNPKARVVYVDVEPIAITHARTILAGNESPGTSTPTYATRTACSPTPMCSTCSTSAGRSRSSWPASCNTSPTTTIRPA
jgi:hypothetical protein